MTNTTEYIESGILELYVFGLLTDDENKLVSENARLHKEVVDEIVEIEKSIIALSTGFSPLLPADVYDKVRRNLIEKHDIATKPIRKRKSYLGWVAALLLLIGCGYLYYELNQANMQFVNLENRQKDSTKNLQLIENQKKISDSALAIIRDRNNIIVELPGQDNFPTSYAKVYINRETQMIYVDGDGLPSPPENMVYQVWALQFDPLRPTSIGLLDNFTANEPRVFSVDNFPDAQGFGITLEQAGGSQLPTMDQLYAMGKIGM